MSEIDKLVNRAYPDELRKVAPIAVDEEAILAKTLEKLGLEKEAQPGGGKKDKHEARHGERRPVRLVEVPLEREKGGWVKWAGWAVAACVAVVFAVTWWPKLEGPRAGAPAAPGAYFKEMGEDIDGTGKLPARAAGDKALGPDAEIIEKMVDSISNGTGISENVGIEAANGAKPGENVRNGITVSQVYPTKTGFTLYVSFQNNTLEEIGQHSFEVFSESSEGSTGYFITKRSNAEGLAIVEFSRGTEESSQDSAVLWVYRMGGAEEEANAGSVVAAFYLYPGENKGIPFSEEDYVLYGLNGSSNYDAAGTDADFGGASFAAE